MKRCTVVAIVVALLVLSVGAVMAQALTKPNGYQTFTMKMGWFQNEPVWHICTATNDIRFAQAHNLTLAPRLSSALQGGSRPVWVTCNSSQPWVFSSTPTFGSYTPYWQVILVEFRPGVPCRPFTGANFPTAQEATFTPTNVIIDCPILAVGQLDGPWLTSGAKYRIPQARAFSNYAYTKQVQLPFWYAFCQNELTRAVRVVKVVVTESANQAIARQLGTNYAPTLFNVPQPDVQTIAGFADCPPPGQYPILEYCPTSLDWRNTQFGYSPVMVAVTINRTTVRPWTIVNNIDTIRDLITSGAVTLTPVTRVNASVVGL